VFSGVAPGEVIRLQGMGARDLELAVPLAPSMIRLRARGGSTEVPARVRSIHFDSDRMMVWIIYGHAFRYVAGSAPEWIVAQRRQAA